jgi:Nucleoside-diphosphate-sugar pyrophosphorylase involved in lipopolysaccharide biosynthesis/translation initiation factor 2B, gamma/epsilon subunits (eIF-2Bgamma/eIF-2Bepsilon)
MNYAIIAAGEGERLKLEGFHHSKPLLKINGVPMIERIIKICLANGATSISCIINEHSHDLFSFLSAYDFPVKFNLIVKTTESSLHSLYELRKYTQNAPFILMTTDSVFLENEFGKFIHYVNTATSFDGILAVTGFIDDEKPLYVETDSKSNILSFSDSDTKLKLVTGGIYYFKSDIFAAAELLLNKKIYRLRNFLRNIVDDGFALGAYEFSKIVDVDHVSDIDAAVELLSHEKTR